MMCLWMAVSKVCLKTTLNFRWILKLLSDLEHLWPTLSLSRESEAWLANSFKSVLEKWFLLVCYHRQLFPALHNNSLHRLEFLLKCLAFVGNMVFTFFKILVTFRVRNLFFKYRKPSGNVALLVARFEVK